MMIFAKLGTTEKVIVACVRLDAPKVMGWLNATFGGDWVWCETLNWQKKEFIKFDDSLKYEGFHGNPERYCGGIGSMPDLYTKDELDKMRNGNSLVKTRFA